MPIPEFPYIVYGEVKKDGISQSGIVVTIENLTAGGSDTCETDTDGHYIYDDLAQLPNSYSPGDTIKISVPGGFDSFIVASEPEEKEINLVIHLDYVPVYTEIIPRIESFPIVSLVRNYKQNYKLNYIRKGIGGGGWGKRL